MAQTGKRARGANDKMRKRTKDKRDEEEDNEKSERNSERAGQTGNTSTGYCRDGDINKENERKV
eukprot:2129699-Pleurochrysis_carterae.AAC.1